MTRSEPRDDLNLSVFGELLNVQMPREVEPSLNEKQFILKALQQNLRVDGRSLDEFRALELTFGDEPGVADVRLGNTRYVLLWTCSFLLYTDILSQSPRQCFCRSHKALP